MSLIVAARFDTFDAAEKAAAALENEGVAASDLHTFFVNPPGAHGRYPMGGDQAADPDSEGAPLSAVGGAAAVGLVGAIIGGMVALAFTDSMLPLVGGAGVGAYIGSLAGAVYSLGRKRPSRTRQQVFQAKVHEGRPSGVVLAVHTSLEHERHIAEVLRGAGGIEVERAQGRWANGRWEDFDPLISPTLKKDF